MLPHWLGARQGEPIDSALQRAITDVAWRIEELLHWFDAADAVLVRALAGTLTRASMHDLRVARLVFHNMATWLPKEERESLRAAYLVELVRLKSTKEERP